MRSISRRSVLLILLLGACRRAPGVEPLHVFAAASLTDVAESLAEGFPVPVNLSIGPTSQLARQIADGAPADVFLAADRSWIDYLQEKDLLAAAPKLIAHNDLVLVTARATALRIERLEDLVALDDTMIAIADRGVPAGEYAVQALTTAGIYDSLQDRLVGQSDVRTVARAVGTGELTLGIVYASDSVASSESLQVVLSIAPELHDPIDLYAARMKASSHPPAAQQFVDHLLSQSGRGILRDHGFRVP